MTGLPRWTGSHKFPLSKCYPHGPWEQLLMAPLKKLGLPITTGHTGIASLKAGLEG